MAASSKKDEVAQRELQRLPSAVGSPVLKTGGSRTFLREDSNKGRTAVGMRNKKASEAKRGI